MSALQLYTPGAILRRYNFEQIPVASALYKAYKRHHGGLGIRITVPLPELLDDLGKPHDPFWVSEIERVLRTIYAEQKIGYRVDEGTVFVWFTPDVAARTRQDEEPVSLELFGTPDVVHGKVFASLDLIDVQNLSVADMQDRLGPGHAFAVLFETVEGQPAINVLARGNAALKLSTLMVVHLGYQGLTQAELEGLAEVAA